MDPNSSPSSPSTDLPGSLVMPAEPTTVPPAEVPAPVVAPTLETATTQEPSPSPEPELPTPEETSPTADQPKSTEPVFSWQASEYIHHTKGAGWYLVFTVVLVGLLAVAFFTHQWLGGAVFAVMAVAVLVYARKAPRTLTYQLSEDGITIENHHYPFTQFKTFAVLPDISWHAIDLDPTQRFMPRLTILFDDKDFDAIVDHLAEHLPRVDRQPDAVERATRYLRF